MAGSPLLSPPFTGGAGAASGFAGGVVAAGVTVVAFGAPTGAAGAAGADVSAGVGGFAGTLLFVFGNNYHSVIAIGRRPNVPVMGTANKSH